MKVKFWFTALLLFLPLAAHSQGDPGRIAPTTNIPFISQGIVLDGYSVYGILNTTLSTISTMSDMNPAALVDYQSPAIGFSLQFDSKIDRALRFLDAGQQRANPWLPQSFNLVYPAGNFRFGLGAHQKYNQSFDLEIMLITPDDPVGSGETVKYTSETNLYTGSGVAAYSFTSPFHNSHKATLGVQLNLNYLRDSSELYGINAKATDIAIGWTLGLRYDFHDRVKASVSFDKENTFSGNVETNADEVLIISQDSSFIEQSVNPFIANYPDKLKFGLLVGISERIWLTNNFATTFWSSISENTRNQPEFSANLIFNIASVFTVSIGAYYTNNRIEDIFQTTAEDWLFLNCGMKIAIKKLMMEISIADSHLGSSENHKQTIIKFGTGITM